MTSRLAATAVLALLIAAPSWAQSPGQAPPASSGGGMTPPRQRLESAQDREFLRQAAADSKGEVEMGQLAMTRAAGPAVREFGRWMVTDHGAINDALERLSQRLGYDTPPAAPGREDQAALTRLQALNGREFDQQYIPLQLKGHEQAIALFEKELQAGEEPVLRALAQHTLPMLQQHLAEVQELSKLPIASSGSNRAGSSVPPRGKPDR